MLSCFAEALFRLPDQKQTLTSLECVFPQTPQHESKDKKMHFFNSGTVAMDVNIEKSGFFQGKRTHSDID